ncbi:hypothetical protein CAPTEDRAFT_130752 [Capitella teleta]|uniref:UDP-glucuronosyltransferase n=1 Tax=Capitella teleta TaxID=283909 RepID=R7UYM0_CAPTE|nr:hypothetical protein CAPTEDRAFT_130752 [Capitella teleta]|eukprot:ELU11658.1 hypothetical protein CAPTEDRAFT_130752 [Capitella teleta]
MGIDSNRLLRHLPNIHNWADLYSKADLYIVTSDHHLGWPAPAFPNIKYLPGISLQPVQPLGGDMNELLEKNPSGVILASFGSLSVHLPNEIILNFIDAFQRLSQTVIWKIRHLKAEHRELLSQNIHVFNWLAQNDILGHRNVRMFITHCGNNGQHESIYHAVPMIGFPMYFDQFENAARLQQKGIGIEMNMRNFSSDHLVDNILTILKYNSTYKQNAKKISSILRSRPMLPKEEAAYWIEHVTQFGSGHLRPVTTAMSPFEMYGLDVACAGLVSLLVTIIALVCGSLRVIVFITQMRELK